MTKTQIEQANEWQSNHKRLEAELQKSVESCAHWTYQDDGEHPNKDPQFPDVPYSWCEWCDMCMPTRDMEEEQSKRICQ